MLNKPTVLQRFVALIFFPILFCPGFLLGTEWKAGVAKVLITPRQPLWMAGYAARTKPSEGVLEELYVKALALQDRNGKQAVLVTADLLGFTAAISQSVAERVESKHGLSRHQILFNASHTHCGPVLEANLAVAYPLDDDLRTRVAGYTRELEDKVVQAIGAALESLQPARLSLGRTGATFAVNRRVKTNSGYVIGVNRTGPVDHEVPFLAVDTERGQLRALVFGYACHNTTLGGDFYLFHGDYAGEAQQWLENYYPGATTLFLTGCGADANPYPRGTVDLARRHGDSLGRAIAASLTGPLQAMAGPLNSIFDTVSVSFSAPPSRKELEERLQSDNVYLQRHTRLMLQTLDREGRLPTTYPYPIQIWQFGQDLLLIALAGEVVVDYALRLKKEFGPESVWVAGYSNDVFAYIPSLRVLQEGGYEAEGAMIYYGQPAAFAPSVEETIIGKVNELVKKLRPF